MIGNLFVAMTSASSMKIQITSVGSILIPIYMIIPTKAKL